MDPQGPDGWTQTETSLLCAQGSLPRQGLLCSCGAPCAKGAALGSNSPSSPASRTGQQSACSLPGGPGLYPAASAGREPAGPPHPHVMRWLWGPSTGRLLPTSCAASRRGVPRGSTPALGPRRPPAQGHQGTWEMPFLPQIMARITQLRRETL